MFLSHGNNDTKQTWPASNLSTLLSVLYLTIEHLSHLWILPSWKPSLPRTTGLSKTQTNPDCTFCQFSGRNEGNRTRNSMSTLGIQVSTSSEHHWALGVFFVVLRMLVDQWQHRLKCSHLKSQTKLYFGVNSDCSAVATLGLGNKPKPK